MVDCEDNLKVIYQKCTEMTVDVPYYSGLLGFREGPVVIALHNEFCEACPDIKLDVIITDGSGEWHPRGFGLDWGYITDTNNWSFQEFFKHWIWP